MTLENFYKQMNAGLVNMTNLADILELSHPTLRNRRKTKSFTLIEIMKLIEAGIITNDNELAFEWGKKVIEYLNDHVDMKNQTTYQIMYDVFLKQEQFDIYG